MKVSIGTSTFEAEGDADLVKQQYEQFIKALGASTQAPTPANQGGHQPPTPPYTPPGGGVTDAQVRHVFTLEDDMVYLSVLPEGGKDKAAALILLLYGYQKLLGNKRVGAVELAKAADKSGAKVPRVDRTIDAYPNWYQFAGAKRARSYSLTGVGIREAERMVKELAEQ